MKPITATMNIQIFDVTVAAPEPPYTYFGVAESLLPGLRPLASGMPATALSLAFLAAHILECLLKAAGTKTERSEQALKSNPDVRHNIDALWKLAISHGMPLSPSPPTWVENLSRLHNRPFQLRYPTSHTITSPAAEPMTTDLISLLEQVRVFLRS
jgi:hypothetical protein